MFELDHEALHNPALAEKEFVRAFEEYSDALFRHCLIRVRDRDLATDIVHETFTKTWDYLTRGKKIEYLRAFLYRVANNLIVDQSRKNRSTSLDTMVEEDGYEVADESLRDPGEIPDARAAMRLLRELDDIYRSVLELRYIEGLAPKEIARVLNVSENVVSVRLYRGIEKLKKLANKPLIRA